MRAQLDANATTPPLPAVRDAVLSALSGEYANPSSLHGAGRAAARLLSAARADVAHALGARASEVVFTSGATEADRLAVLGALAAGEGRRRVVVSAIEHPAVRDLAEDLARREAETGVSVTWVRPDPNGACRAQDFADALTDDTCLAALMWANNETGVVQPVEAVARACRERGVVLLVDAVQAAGKLPVDCGALGADLVAVSAHKFHGPAGVGALIVRDGARWKPPFPASHEGRRRAGTEPLPAIAGFAAAARELAGAPHERMAALRDRLERSIVGALGGVTVNGTAARTPNTSNLCFHGLDGDRLLALLDRAGVEVSNGSACSSLSPDPSHVLLAMGLPRADALASVRFSLSRLTRDAEVDHAVAATIETVETLRRSGRGSA